VEAETTLVRAKGGVELDTVAPVDLQLVEQSMRDVPRVSMRMTHISHTSPLSSSQTTRNWTIRSGMEQTLRALRYSGYFWNRVEFSSVEASSVKRAIVSHCSRLPMANGGVGNATATPRLGGGKDSQAVTPLYACSNSGS